MSPDFENVLAELLSLLHHMSLAKTVPEALDEFVSAREALLKLSETVSAEDLHLFYQIALIGRRDLPLSPDDRNGFEMIMLRMLAFRPANVDAGQVVQATQQVSNPSPRAPQNQAAAPRVAQPHAKTTTQTAVQPTSQGVSESMPQSRPQPAPDASAAPQRPADNSVAEPGQPVQAETPVRSGVVSNDWREVVNSLGLGGLVKQLAINCTMQQRDGCNIMLQIASGHSNLINPKAKQRLQQALGEYFNIDAQLDIKVVDQVESESPAQTVQRETVERQEQAVASINEDSFTQTLKEQFNAEIVPGSVKPVT
jgi:DNA polymerase-3 subunit gamma/tau